MSLLKMHLNLQTENGIMEGILLKPLIISICTGMARELVSFLRGLEFVIQNGTQITEN